MRKISYLAALAFAVTFASCTQKWEKAVDGMEYKIIHDGKGNMVKSGDFVEMQISTVFNNGKKDSLLNTTYESGMPEIIQFDSVSIPPAFYTIFKQLKKGDSLTTRMMTDSIFKTQPDQMPPFMKKGQYLYRNVRITNIYKTKEDADKGRQAAAKIAEEKAKVKSAGQAKTDDKILADYLKSKNINATKTANGTYVEILQPGTGPMIDTSVVAKVSYTGKLLNGTVFDSNTDPAKGSVEPLSVNLTSNPMLGVTVIPGMSEGLKLLNSGAKARLYIPSVTAYGPQANERIPANSNLIFDVEIVSLMNREQAMQEMGIMQKKMMDMQKKYADSIGRTQGPAGQ